MTASIESSFTGNPRGSSNRIKAALGSGMGTTVENYDFVVYGTGAALYFGAAFFHDKDPLVGTLLAFLTYAVGFVARPLGGIVGGFLGDKIGRRPVLFASLILMGVATIAIGILPTYAQIGSLAALLLTVVRVVQGFCFGAEWGGAMLMTYEHAPWRFKGLFCAIPQSGIPAGNLLGALAFVASSGLEGDWRWRAPFLFTAVLVLVGIYIRLRVEESPAFSEAKAQKILVKNPVLSVLRHDWRNVLRAMLLRAAENAGYAIGITYLSSYVNVVTGNSTLAVTAIAIAAGIGVAAVILWGRLTDGIGRRSVSIIGSVLMVVLAFPAFLLVNTGLVFPIIIAFVCTFCLVENTLAAVQGPWFAEFFPTTTRASGASLAYQVAAIVGGLTPAAAVALFGALGWVGPALLYAGFGLLGLIVALVTPETFGRDRREYARAAADAVTDEDAVHAV